MRIVLNRKGMRELLRSDGVAEDLERRGQAIAAAAGDGVEAESAYLGKNRARVTVRTATTEARIAEAKDRVLTRAIETGRQ